jgi:hypothetical protein
VQQVARPLLRLEHRLVQAILPLQIPHHLRAMLLPVLQDRLAE